MFALNTNRSEMITSRPLVAADPVPWNKEIAMHYLDKFENDPENYRNLELSDLWYGDDNKPETGWCFDGVCSMEEGDQGTPTRDADGVDNFMMPAGGRMGKGKIMTVIIAGQQEMLDYGKSRGLIGCATLWGRLSRMPLQELGGLEQTYTVSHKSGPLMALPLYAPGSTLKTQPLATMKAKGPAYAELVHTFRPPQFEFFYMPDGSKPPMSFSKSVNEWGDVKYDAILCPIARVLFPPLHNESKMPLPSGDSIMSAPCTDGLDIMKREYFTGIVFASKDGALDAI